MQINVKRAATSAAFAVVFIACVSIASKIRESSYSSLVPTARKEASIGDRPGASGNRVEESNGRRKARPDAGREIAACLDAVTRVLETSERERIVDRSDGVRAVQLTPELRKAYLASDETETINVRMVSLVVKRPTDAERDDITRTIDEGLSGLHFVDVDAREDLKRQLVKKRFNYKKDFKIIRMQMYTDELGVEHRSIISYDTDHVVQWEGESGVMLSPEDASDIEVMKGGREAYMERYAHLFK